MKRLLLLLMISLLVMMGVSGAALAVPTDDLTALAEYAPEDAPVFVAIRTDDGYIETLDGVLGRFAELGLIPPEASVEDILDAFVMNGLPLPVDGTYDELVRPWIGETAAIMVPSVNAILNGDVAGGVVAAISVADNAAAEAFLNDYFGDVLGDRVIRTETASGGTLYDTQNSFEPSVLLEDGVMFVGLAPVFAGLVLPDMDAVSLSQTTEFQDTMGALPNGDYNIAVYIDPTDTLNELAGLVGFLLADSDMEDMASELATVGDMVGQQALGFTIIDGRSFVLDYAAVNSNFVDMGGESEPVNLELLGNVEADTSLVIMGNGIGDTINGLFTMLDLLDEFLTENGLTLGSVDEVPQEFNIINAGNVGVFIRQAFEGTTGLDLDETLDWMNGTFALTVRTEPGELDGVELPLPQTAFLIETDNPDATADYVEAMADIATDILAYATFEDGVLNIPFAGGTVQVPEEFAELVSQFDSVLASNDELVVFGTPSTAEFALNPDGDSLLDSEGYAYESTLFLEEADSMWLINVPPLAEAALDFLSQEAVGAPEEDLMMLEDVLDIPFSSSITTSSVDGVQRARLTISLSE